MSEELLKCDLEIYDLAEGQLNIYRCARCGNFVEVLGDRCPPSRNCSAPEGTRAKPTMKQILLKAVQTICDSERDVYSIWFYVSLDNKKHYFASWGSNGFKFD